MLAIRRTEQTASLTLRPAIEKPARASIGAKRNPASTRAILDAAQAILRRDGLAGLSMDAIARQAQCGKPTLYRWWPDKCSLLADIHDRAIESITCDASESIDSRIDRVIDHWIDAWRDTLAGIALRGMLAEAQSSSAAHAVLIDRGFAPYRLALEAIVGPDEVEATLRRTLLPLLGELMLSGDVSRGRVRSQPRRPVVRSIEPAAPIESVQPIEAAPPAQTIRHRGEWVD